MAKQKGILPIEGTIGNLTFLKTKDGYMVKQKSEISADKIANDPAFLRTRENNAEFARAAKAGKVLRTAFRSLVKKASDHRMVSRLTKRFKEVIKLDAVNPRGMRNVIDGEATLLEGFDFNINGKLNTTLYAGYTTSINRVTGELKIEIPGFVPTEKIAAPAGTTHFRIMSSGASVDFENKVFTEDSTETGYLPLNDVATAATDLSNMVATNSTHPLILILGIEFFQEVNGTQYPLKNGVFNALSVVKVDA